MEDVLKIGETVNFLEKSGTMHHGLITLTYPQEMDPEASEIVAGFNRCFTVAGIFRLLETIPAEEVTPPVAVHAINRIIEFKRNVKMQCFLPEYGQDNLA